MLFALAATLGTLFRSATWWRIAIGLIVASLLFGVTAALLDHMGYAR
jgi:hypothetical protein